MELITLRPICGIGDDLEFVRNLRNANRAYFFDSRWILDWQQHEWFMSLPKRKGYTFYIIHHNGFRIGTISRQHLFDIPFRKSLVPVYELGNLMLLHHYQGKGFMHATLNRLQQEPAFYIAYVKSGNDRSVNVFERSNFAKIRRTDV